MQDQDSNLTAAALAIHLGRREPGRSRFLVTTVAKDAAAIVSAGVAAKAARSKSAREEAFAEAQRVADKYCAEVVRRGEIRGVTLGVRFWGDRNSDFCFRVA